MFNYTNTFLINTAVDKLSGKQKFEADVTNKKLNVLRAVSLPVSGIKEIHKTVAADPVLGKVEFTLVQGTGANQIKEGDICRVNIYIRQNGNNDSRYANSLYLLKGRPFLYEFRAKGSTATEIATNAAKTINKTIALFGNQMIKVSSNAAKLILSCMDEYQLITDAAVEKLVQDNTSILAVEPYNRSKFVPIITGAITKSKEGVGTYDVILKNLRLPTIENLRWNSPAEPEMPIVGAKYTQYVIYFEKFRGVMGGDAMGEVSTSRTCHVFYIKEDLVESFEAVLTSLSISFTGTTYVPADPVAALDARIKVLEQKP